MALCELCGRNGSLVKSFIEGTTLDVCNSCKSLGKTVYEPHNNYKIKQFHKEEKTEDLILEYNKIIQKRIQELNISCNELAEKLKEKESFVTKIVHGSIKPNIGLAVKIEKLLNIKIVVKEDLDIKFPKEKGNFNLTIGDVIDIKK